MIIKKYKLNKLLLLVMLSSFFVGCSLDPSKDGSLTENDVWNNTTRSFAYLNNIYNYIPNGYNRIDGAMLASGSDEAINSNVLSDVLGFNDGRWNQYFLIENVWDKNYLGIRATNMFLSKINDVPIPENTTIQGSSLELERTKSRMIGEAFFLRALFYTELVKRYGGVPLTLEPLTPDETITLPRSSVDECMTQIVMDCDSAYNRLPAQYDGSIPGFNLKTDLGRATQGAALALKSRAYLYWASPLFNTSNDLTRWAKAAEAAKKVIDSNLYTMTPYASGESVGNIYYVSGTHFPQYNTDLIFTTSYSATNSFEKSNTPPSYGGSGYTNPTQNMVDAFPMANGKQIDEVGSGYDPANPYANRDPRFYMTIAYNGENWMMNGQTTPIETFEGGKDATGQYPTSTKTGYYLAKLLSKSAVWDGTTTNIQRTWAIIRYAEVLLNYAEAENESIATPDESVYTAIEAIRKHAGLNPYTIIRGKTQAQMREIIHNERRIELAFEEHRFFDVRRWKLYDDATQREELLSIKGMDIKNTNGSLIYSPFVVEKRLFSDKMYLYPIPQSEILKGNMTQNPGW